MKFAWTCPLHGTRQTAARFCGNASYRLYKTSSGTQVSPMMGASTSRYLPPALSHVTSQQPLEGSGSRRVAAGPAPASASPGTRRGGARLAYQPRVRRAYVVAFPRVIGMEEVTQKVKNGTVFSEF
uniref:Uncharacterized protein n=1 Tax=Rousettus aegyptiacus TaxID=9407 RepID=A0A7J8H0N7_ROUAE|nr:hypothetical protein HJG63_011183 [Rousettus aegyptiacus]